MSEERSAYDSLMDSLVQENPLRETPNGQLEDRRTIQQAGTHQPHSEDCQIQKSNQTLSI